ncbi:MAG: N-acetylmuramidase domain-containing protein [Methylococcaceae bacterium]
MDTILCSQNWEAFTLGYNGSDFKKNKYDQRLAATYAKYNVILPDLALRTAQTVLLYFGFNPGTVDGVTAVARGPY